MSKKVAFFVIALPFTAEYEAAITPKKEVVSWGLYADLCFKAWAEISHELHLRLHDLGLSRQQIPKLLGLEEFEEPFLFIRQLCPEATEKLLALGELAGYKLTPVYFP